MSESHEKNGPMSVAESMAPSDEAPSAAPNDAAPAASHETLRPASATGAASAAAGTASEAKIPAPESGATGSIPPRPGGRGAAPSAPTEAQPSIASRIFDLLALFPLLPLTIILVFQTIGGFESVRALWFSDEVRHANVYENVVEAGKWLVLYLNGVPYPDKPPVYFWFLGGLDAIPGVDAPMLFFLGAAVSGLLLLWATYGLARATGNDSKTGLAAGLILLGCFYFLGVTHYARMDLLFAACITLCHICMVRGWSKPSAPLWLISAYALAALATLIKGPLGLALPVLSGVLFVLWQGKFRRLNGRDGVAGFGIMLVILLGWVTVIWFSGEHEYLRNIMQDQIVKRATDTWHHGQPWWHYLVTFPAAWLPWTLLLLTLPWGRLLRNPLRPIMDSRKGEGLGTAYLWISLLSGTALLSVISIKIVIYLLPLFPPLAIITARALLRLPARNSRVFYLLVSLLLLLLAVAFGSLTLLPWAPESLRLQLPPQALALLDMAKGAGILAGVCFLFSLLLLKCTDRSQPRGALLVVILFATIFVQPLSLYTAPSLDPVMSPKAQAEIIGAYASDGFTPMSYRVYPGTYTYYARTNLHEITTRDWALLDAAVAENPKIVLAMRLDDWEEWPNRPADMREIQRQWIVDRQFVVVVRDAAHDVPMSQTVEGAPATPALPNGDAAPGESGTHGDGVIPNGLTPDGITPDGVKSGPDALKPLQGFEPAPAPGEGDAPAKPHGQQEPATPAPLPPASDIAAPALTQPVPTAEHAEPAQAPAVALPAAQGQLPAEAAPVKPAE